MAGKPAFVEVHMSREELEQKAKDLNIDVDKRWSDNTLSQKIEEAETVEEVETTEEAETVEEVETTEEAETVEGSTVLCKTTHNGKFIVDGIEFLPGGLVGLTPDQAEKAIQTGFVVKA